MDCTVDYRELYTAGRYDQGGGEVLRERWHLAVVLFPAASLLAQESANLLVGVWGCHFIHQCACIMLTFNHCELNLHSAWQFGEVPGKGVRWGGGRRTTERSCDINEYVFSNYIKVCGTEGLQPEDIPVGMWLLRGLLEVKRSTTQNTRTANAPLPPSLTGATTKFQSNHHYSVTGLILLQWQQGSPVMDYKGSGAVRRDWGTTKKSVSSGCNIWTLG